MLNATSTQSYGISFSIATSFWFGERLLLMWRRKKASRHRQKKTHVEESTAAH